MEKYRPFGMDLRKLVCLIAESVTVKLNAISLGIETSCRVYGLGVLHEGRDF